MGGTENDAGDGSDKFVTHSSLGKDGIFYYDNEVKEVFCFVSMLGVIVYLLPT